MAVFTADQPYYHKTTSHEFYDDTERTKANDTKAESGKQKCNAEIKLRWSATCRTYKDRRRRSNSNSNEMYTAIVTNIKLLKALEGWRDLQNDPRTP